MPKNEDEIGTVGPAGAPEGFVLVPIIPTPEMLEAAKYSAWAEDAGGVWRDMIEALLAK